MTHIQTAPLDKDQETIVALCTPRGNGALALIRLTGIDAVKITDKITKLSSKKKLQDCKTHTIHHGFVIIPNNKPDIKKQDQTKNKSDSQTPSDNKSNIIDEVLFFLMRAPKTFTGQDTVEISCHNNLFIVDSIINCCVAMGARLAQAGEYSKRAYLNGKIDLLQAEAINEMISAQTELALRTSLAQLQGSLSHHIKTIETDLFNLLCLIESSFEFLEEEQHDLNIDNIINQKTHDLLTKINDTKAHFNTQQQIKEGLRIAIIGSVNAGKSTLFNALVKKERAIVTSQPGTTRDSIEYSLYKNGNFWLVIDTAGIRHTQDSIEQEGIQRSYNEAATADIILLVIDASSKLDDHEQKIYTDLTTQYPSKIITILNKVDIKILETKDLQFLHEIQPIHVSAKDNIGITNLETKIETKIQNLFAQLQSPFLLNQRQFKLLSEIALKLENIADSYTDVIQYELAAYHLKEILENIAQLTGKNITEGLLDTIFKTFCVGK